MQHSHWLNYYYRESVQIKKEERGDDIVFLGNVKTEPNMSQNQKFPQFEPDSSENQNFHMGFAFFKNSIGFLQNKFFWSV